MRASRYNIILSIPNHGTAIYNTLTRRFVLLASKDPNVYRKRLESGSYWCPTSGEFHLTSELFAKGMLVNNTTDELLHLKFHHDHRVYNSKCPQFAIYPAEGCNLTCAYCPQRWDTISPVSLMSPSMSVSVAEFILKILNRTGQRYATVSFTGGEPLLNVSACRLIMETLTKASGNGKLSISFQITTNGHFLPEPEVKTLLSYRPTFHLTIEGPEPIHDSVRKTRGGAGSYRRILSGLRILVTRNLPFAIRLHLNTLGPEPARVLDDLVNAGVKSTTRCLIYMVPSVDIGDAAGFCVSDRFLSGRLETLELGRRIIADLSSHSLASLFKWGIYLPEYPLALSYMTCPFDSSVNYVISGKGKLYKCVEDILEETCVGDVIEGGEWRLNSRYYALLNKKYPVANICENCPYFPVCGGPCIRKPHPRSPNDCQMYHDYQREYLIAYVFNALNQQALTETS